MSHSLLAAACGVGVGAVATLLTGQQRQRVRARGAEAFDLDPRLLEGKHEVRPCLVEACVAGPLVAAGSVPLCRQSCHRHCPSPLCPQVCDLPLCKVLLCDDANYPCWVVLVPRVNRVTEVLQLTEAQQAQLWREVAAAARVIQVRVGGVAAGGVQGRACRQRRRQQWHAG